MNYHTLQQPLKAICCILLGNRTLQMRGGPVESVESRAGATHLQKYWLNITNTLPQLLNPEDSGESTPYLLGKISVCRISFLIRQ